MTTDRELEALREIAERSKDRERAAETYRELWAYESVRLLLREEPALRSLDGASRRELFSERFSSETPDFQVEAALALTKEARLFEEEGAELTAPSGVRTLALTESRFSAALRGVFFEDTVFSISPGYEDACDSTADGACDGCLLPCLDGDGRPLIRTMKLVSEYGLKKALLLPLETQEERATFALYARALPRCPAPDFAELSFFPEAGSKEALRLLCRRFGFELTIGRCAAGVTAEIAADRRAEDLYLLLSAARLLLPRASLEGLGTIVDGSSGLRAGNDKTK